MWKSRLAFSITALISGVLIWYPESRFYGFLLLYSLLLLFLLSLASILLAPVFLTVTENVSKTLAEKQEVLHYTHKISNKSLFPYFCVHQEYQGASHFRSLDPVTKGSLPSRRVATQDYSLSFPYRGEYSIGLKSLKASDFLGLFTRQIPTPSKVTVLVYPTADLGFYSHAVGHRESGEMQSQLMEDYTVISDIRQHTPGESLKKVHWKLTAKWGELMVKEFEPLAGSHIILFLDTKTTGLSGDTGLAFEDKVISFVSAAVNYYRLEQMPAKFIYGVLPLEQVEVSAFAEEKSLLHTLATVKFSKEETLVPHYYNAISQESRPLFIYFFLFDLDPDTLLGLGRFLASGHAIVLYYFYSHDLPIAPLQEELLSGLESQGVIIYRIEVDAYGKK